MVRMNMHADPGADMTDVRANANTVSADTDASSHAANVSSHLDGIRTRCASPQQGQCEERRDKLFHGKLTFLLASRWFFDLAADTGIRYWKRGEPEKASFHLVIQTA